MENIYEPQSYLCLQWGICLEEKASTLTQGGWGTWGEGTGKFHNKY